MLPALMVLLVALDSGSSLALAASGVRLLAESINSEPANSGEAQARPKSNRDSVGGNLDAATLLEFGMNPIGSSMKFLLPNTMKALNSDVSNGYMMLTNGAQNGMNGFQTGYNTLNDYALNRYNTIQKSLASQYASGEELLLQMMEMMANPQLMCNNLAAQSQAAMQSANQQMNKVNQQTDSMVGNLGSTAQTTGQQVSQATSSLLNKLGGLSFGK